MVIGVLLLVTISVAIYAFRQRNKAADAQHVARAAQQFAEKKEQEAVHAAEEAERQRIAAVSAAKEADQQRQVALVRLARYFAAESKASIEAQPTLSILLSIEALKMALIPAAEEALRDAITKIAAHTTLVGHEKGGTSVAFSPDGQVLATTSRDQTVRLWSLSTPTVEPRVLRGHENSIGGVAFSPDGQVLATTSRDQTVRLWSMVIDDLVRIVCQLTSGNFRYEEWQRYMGDEPYRKTCQNHPLHPSFLEIIRRQVKNGDVEGAVTKLQVALQAGSSSDVVLQKEARRLAAPALVEKGQELAREGDIDGAVVTFQQALDLDPNLALDPQKEARRLAASGLVDGGRELAKQGAIREAMAAFEAAQANDPYLEIAAASWNSLCWFGSLGGFATDVMAACERAVALEPDNGGIRDSRGVASALTGDYPGAINDFQQYLEWGPQNGTPQERIRQRQDWIRMLQANQNPFNEELLKLIRDQ
jgi:tetratricopeptide (TPR) repeat protein